MNAFTVHLQGATQYERIDHAVSFVGEDDSGSFGLMAGHGQFVTTLVFGLARLRYADERWDYLALPEAVAHFDGGELYLSTRRYLRSDDYAEISQALREEMAQEEQDLTAFKQNLEQMERAMLLRLWCLGRGEERA
jgi:F-type H+-transporting ATPase subunit epsilon